MTETPSWMLPTGGLQAPPPPPSNGPDPGYVSWDRRVELDMIRFVADLHGRFGDARFSIGEALAAGVEPPLGSRGAKSVGHLLAAHDGQRLGDVRLIAAGRDSRSRARLWIVET